MPFNVRAKLLEWNWEPQSQAELALGGPVPGNVREPQLIRRRCGEYPHDVVIVHGRTGLACQAALLGKHGPDQLAAAQPRRLDLLSAETLVSKLVDDEWVPERPIVPMDIQRRVDQVRIRPVTSPDRRNFPRLEGLFGETQHPAGHRDGNSFSGKAKN